MSVQFYFETYNLNVIKAAGYNMFQCLSADATGTNNQNLDVHFLFLQRFDKSSKNNTVVFSESFVLDQLCVQFIPEIFT